MEVPSNPESSALSASEVIRIRCPGLACQRILTVPSKARGKLVRCAGCGATIRIPLPRSIEPDLEEPEETPKKP